MSADLARLGIQVELKGFTETLNRLRQIEKEALSTQRGFDKTAAAISQETAAATKLTKEFAAQQKMQADAMAGVAQAQEKSVQGLIACCKQCATSSDESNKSIAQGNSLLDDRVETMETLADKAKKAAEAYRENLGKARDFWSGLERGADKQVAELSNYAKYTEKALGTFISNVDGGFTKMWQSAANCGKLTSSSFKDTLSSMKVYFNNFLGELIHTALTRPIMVSVVGAFGGVVGGLLGNPNNAYAGGLGGGSGSGGFGGANPGDLVKLADSAWNWLSGGSSAVPAAPSTGMASAEVIYQKMLDAGHSVAEAGKIAADSIMSGNAMATTSEAGSRSLGGASTALGYAGSAIGGYFMGQSFYGGMGAKMGLPQGRETGWASGAGGALGAIGATYAMSAAGLGITSAAVGAATAAGGATAGAAAGSVVPVVGTIIGAVVGAIAGGLMGSLGGKEREMRVYTGMRTNLADPGAYLNIHDNQQAMAGAFHYGDYSKGDFLGDWNAINVKGSTGHSAYYIDPVHAGGSGGKVAAGLDPYVKQIETMMLEMAKETTAKLPEQLQAQFTRELSERPVWVEYKFKPKDLDEEGVKAWVEDWAGKAEEVLFQSFQALDFSEWQDKITVNKDDASGFSLFLNAVNAIEQVKTATEALGEPAKEYVSQALAAQAQLQEWEQTMRGFGVTTGYATELMDEYRLKYIDTMIGSVNESLSPASKLSTAMEQQRLRMDDWIESLKILGATQDQVTEAEWARTRALEQTRAAVLQPIHQDFNLRLATLVSGDNSALQREYADQQALDTMAATVGKDSKEYDALLAIQEAEKLAHEADLARAEYEKYANAEKELKSAVENATSAVESTRLAFVHELIAALDSARNGIKEAVDAWADGAKSEYQTAANAYLSALQTELNTYKALADRLRSAQLAIWTDSGLSQADTVYNSSRAEVDRLYGLAKGGDASAGTELAGFAKTFLTSSAAATGDYGVYLEDFAAMQKMLRELETEATTQVDSLQIEIDILESQLDVAGKSNKTLSELRDIMNAAKAQYGEAEAERQAAYARWGFEAVVPGIEGLKSAYHESVAAWEKAQKDISDAILTGITTQGEIDSLRVVNKLDDLKAQMAKAQADQNNYNSQLLTLQTGMLAATKALSDTARKAADDAIANADKKVQEAEKQAGLNVYGSRFETVDALVSAKVAKLNSDKYEGRGDWAASDFYAAIAGLGLSVEDWYRQWGKLEGFAKGGTASGWAMVGEMGPELAYFGDSAKIYTASQTHGMLMGPPQTDGSPEAIRGVLAEMQAQNSCLRTLIKQMGVIIKNTRNTADSLGDITENGVGTYEQQNAQSQPVWAD